MKRLVVLFLMMLAAANLFAQQYEFKGGNSLTLRGGFSGTTLDSNYAVIDVSVSTKERIDILKTNFVISKEYRSEDKNQMRVFVKIPDLHCNQPLVVTSDNYEDCIIQITQALNSPFFHENIPLWYSVRLSAEPIKTNHIIYDLSKETTKTESKLPLKIRNFGTDTSKKIINYFQYVAAYQNDSLDILKKNYVAVDINLRRELFDIDSADYIFKMIKYPGKIRVVIDNSVSYVQKQIVVKTDHYKTRKITIPYETGSTPYKSKLKTKNLYNVVLEAPAIDNCISVLNVPIVDTVCMPLDMVFVRGNSKLNIKDFYISKYEITNKQFYDIMGYYINPSIPKTMQTNYKTDCNLPTTMVSWDEAMDYCKKLGEKIGKKVTLPTVKQWEYTAKGGVNNDLFEYSGSDKLDDVAWYYENAHETTQRVGRKMPNSLGIFDMTGNAKEWCMDKDGDDKRITKGGSVREGQNHSGTYLRINSPTVSTKKTDFPSDLGFRVIYEP